MLPFACNTRLVSELRDLKEIIEVNAVPVSGVEE
jgi:hypothetical protein